MAIHLSDILMLPPLLLPLPGGKAIGSNQQKDTTDKIIVSVLILLIRIDLVFNY